MPDSEKTPIAQRFRSFLPVVVDIETAGFNSETDAMLEIAAVLLCLNDRGEWVRGETISSNVEPFPGANLEQSSLDFTGIDPFHPFRIALPEKKALDKIFKLVRHAVKEHECTRAILVGHNPAFDLAFLKAAVDRAGIKRNPFHSFSSFDTATLGGLAYGQTVLARAVQVAGFDWDENQAHSAVYDAEQTAELFCTIVNRWDRITTI